MAKKHQNKQKSPEMDPSVDTATQQKASENSVDQTDGTQASAKQETQDDQADQNASQDDQRQALKQEIETLQRQVAQTEKKAKQAEEEKLRIQAEMENVRRRAERDVQNAHKFALEKFVNDLLPVLDSFDKALDHQVTHEESSAILEGVALTQKMLLDVMGKFGVTCLAPHQETFYPKHHEDMPIKHN